MSTKLNGQAYPPDPKLQIFKRVALAVLFIAALVSHAYRFSNDLQWSGTRLLVNHTDPYETYLAGDPSHSLMRWQIPNYLHELYIFELPLGYVSFPVASCIWAAVNLVFLSITFVILIRFYKLSQLTAVAFTLLVLCSTAFRNSLGNGQQDILATLSFAAVVCLAAPKQRCFGISGTLAKYNFAPVVLGYLFAEKQLWLILASLVIPAAGYLIFLWFIHFQQPLHVAFEPFLVSRSGITPGKADLMTAIEQLPFSSPSITRMMAYAIGMFSAVGYGVLVSRSRLSPQAAAASMAAATLVTVKHVDYDLLLMIVPFAYLITKRTYASFVSLLVIGELFYVDRWLPEISYLSSFGLRLIYMLKIVGVIASIHYTDRHPANLQKEQKDACQATS